MVTRAPNAVSSELSLLGVVVAVDAVALPSGPFLLRRTILIHTPHRKACGIKHAEGRRWLVEGRQAVSVAGYVEHGRQTPC